ncbi:MAG TPA: hypothetical protein VOB72_20795 [Candidatus Dormibacteraeota bacterium]|nr:hypothetical protein [Candidatus Dormibacteraeota bacterium]
MKPVQDLLGRVRLRLLRDRALAWGANGLAAAAVLALAVELVERRWPIDPAWPALVGAAAVGLLVTTAGWVLAWPSWPEVARVADRRLGGRERLTTALQFATEGGWLYTRQREDAATFALGADLAGLGPLSAPFKTLVLATVAGIAALVLAVLPNPAVQQLRQHRAQAAAQAVAADEVQQIARQLGQGAPGEDPVKRQALTQELQKASSAARQAPDPQSAVASLSQAQDALRQLQDPNQGQKQDAAAGAGKQLSQNADAAKAGQALASQDLQGANSELNKLAQNLPNLSQQQQQQLAQSLSQAANAAGGAPKLQQSLQQASQALQQGNVQAAQQALQQAAQEAQALQGEDQFQGDVNQAINGLQQAKQPLENQAGQQGQNGQNGQQGQSGQQGQGQQGQGQQGQSGQQGQGAQQGQGQQAGQGQGQAAQGAGQGQGQSQGQGQGQGQGGDANGGGSGGGNATKPAASSEKVYVTGQAQDTGQGQNQGNQAGVQNDLVPYQQVLADYRASALSQVDRADIPDQQRQLVQQYFSDLGGQ